MLSHFSQSSKCPPWVSDLGYLMHSSAWSLMMGICRGKGPLLIHLLLHCLAPCFNSRFVWNGKFPESQAVLISSLGSWAWKNAHGIMSGMKLFQSLKNTCTKAKILYVRHSDCWKCLSSARIRIEQRLIEQRGIQTFNLVIIKSFMHRYVPKPEIKHNHFW